MGPHLLLANVPEGVRGTGDGSLTHGSADGEWEFVLPRIGRMAQQRAPARARPSGPEPGPESPLSALPGVNAINARRLRRLGLETVRDLLLNLPYEWESYGEPSSIAELRPGTQATVVVTVASIASRPARYRPRMRVVEATVADDAGSSMRVTWFNKPYLVGDLPPGERVALAGEVKASRGWRGLEMVEPQLEHVGAGAGLRWVGGLMPKYHLTDRLTSRRIAAWVDAVLPLAGRLEDDIPEPARQRLRLLPLAEAVQAGHHPESRQQWREAQRRLESAQLLQLQAAFLLSRQRIALERATPIDYRQEVIDAFKAGVGFELTHAQRRATWEIYKDLRQEVPMNRLLNGDVGSGKTAVAAAAAAMAHASGLQTVVMAPTEILARQHLNKFRAYLEPSLPGLSVELLISDLPAAERRRVRMSAASGLCALLVGTHALIEEEVELASLGLAVVDEQHRFGTRQRELLRQKSATGRPHFMAMTATPIPRSLALALYGEMTFSVI